MTKEDTALDTIEPLTITIKDIEEENVEFEHGIYYFIAPTIHDLRAVMWDTLTVPTVPNKKIK